MTDRRLTDVFSRDTVVAITEHVRKMIEEQEEDTDLDDITTRLSSVESSVSDIEKEYFGDRIEKVEERVGALETDEDIVKKSELKELVEDVLKEVGAGVTAKQLDQTLSNFVHVNEFSEDKFTTRSDFDSAIGDLERQLNSLKRNPVDITPQLQAFDKRLTALEKAVSEKNVAEVSDELVSKISKAVVEHIVARILK